MKSKEFGRPGGGRASLTPPLDPPMGTVYVITYNWSVSLQANPSISLPAGQVDAFSVTPVAKFSRKLHEIERIWTPRGGACVPHAPPRSANGDSLRDYIQLECIITSKSVHFSSGRSGGCLLGDSCLCPWHWHVQSNAEPAHRLGQRAGQHPGKVWRQHRYVTSTSREDMTSPPGM